MCSARRSRKARWPLTVALAAPALVQAAAYLPGAPADPPTGEVAPPAPPEAREPLQGRGFEWRFAPWRVSGLLALDARWLRFDDGRRSTLAGVTGEVEAASYLWQPWFARVRLGLGWLASRDQVRGGEGSEDDSGSATALTGRAELSLFPASRFPFDARFEVGDSRASGEASTLGRDQRTTRLALTQQYRPAASSDHYQLQVDASRIDADEIRDSLVAVNGNALLLRGAHTYEISGSASDNRRSGDGSGDLRSRLAALSARHSWRRDADLAVESLASWHRSRFDNDALADFGTELRQISTLATWRPRAGEPLYWDGHAVQWVGSARWVESGSAGSGLTSSALSATAGVNAELSPLWRAAASASMNQFSAALGDTTRNANAAASLTWSPAMREWGDWRYAPGASFNASFTRGGGAAREVAGAQFAHSVSRDFALGEEQRLSLSFAQGGSVTTEFNHGADDTDPLAPERAVARSLNHTVGLFWQGQTGGGSGQRFASLSASDGRSWSEQGDTVFQLVNLQLTQRQQLSRYSSWSASLTVQASRNHGVLRLDPRTDSTVDTGWLTTANGSLSHDNARWLGVPRLRLTLLGTISTQQLQTRTAGDVNAPLERVSRSAEARVDYAIGRLEARLSLRAARVDERTVAAIVARLQRRF